MDNLIETRSSKEPEGRAVARRGLARGRILVVDDDVALLALLAAGLEHVGFEVIKAGDGFDALASMYARRPDVILVDLAMARMNGLELIAQVCTENTFRDVTVVAMSGHEGLLQRATLAGATAALVKPLSIPGIVGALLRHRRRSVKGAP